MAVRIGIGSTRPSDHPQRTRMTPWALHSQIWQQETPIAWRNETVSMQKAVRSLLPTILQGYTDREAGRCVSLKVDGHNTIQKFIIKDQSTFRCCEDKTRVFIVSDISNEPDDAESLVRYLLYCNEFDTRGLVACTSTWMKRAVHPEDMHKIIDAYEKVLDNLNKNVHLDNQYPSAESIRALVKIGPVLYGKEALEPDVPLSKGAKLLIERLDESHRPPWILCWCGTNVLAQALQHVSQNRSPKENARLRSKMRVYAISDQDDTGAWIRHQYPNIFYIASVHGCNQYGLAAWTGISGDKFYGFDQGGPSFEKMTKEWIKENIQVGSLGAAYRDYLFIPEGDTPTFLYLIQNGLGRAEHPEWGSWGGRYLPSNAGVVLKHYADAVDRVVGADGRTHVSNHAAVWRWRDAFQDSFAARIQ